MIELNKSLNQYKKDNNKQYNTTLIYDNNVDLLSKKQILTDQDKREIYKIENKIKREENIKEKQEILIKMSVLFNVVDV